MLLINQIKLLPTYSDTDLLKKICGTLKVSGEDIIDYRVLKQSIDARKKPDIFYVLSVSVSLKNEKAVLKRNIKDVTIYNPVIYNPVISGEKELTNPPVIVGAGPCGLFAAYELAINGYKPIVIERGKTVDLRTEDVTKFWETGILKPDSNVLFGEGGAGTFSDGKLNTLVKDKLGRNGYVLDILVRFGAPERIKYENKPHIGTDILVDVVSNIRKYIIECGGTFLFETKLTDIKTENNHVVGIEVNKDTCIPCEALLLCIGHSARDTFKMLYDKGIYLEQKDFAVGFRVEHKQEMIDKALYTDSEEMLKLLPPAAYKLAYQSEKYNRGVYSFCMCPGGFVVNSSSEDGCLCINGMSYSRRDGENANSAIVMTVRRDDFGSDHPLAGIDYQRKIERNAYEAGSGRIPVMKYGDFKKSVIGLNVSETDQIVEPNNRGFSVFADITGILSNDLNNAFIEGMEHFSRVIPGFSNSDTIVSAVESRTSSPVRISRDEYFESVSLKGLYPGGEGAGYAGGITSAAMDGLKLFEEIARRYKPFNK